MDARWEEELAGLGEKVKGLRSTNWQLQTSQGDAKNSAGNVVSNTVITGTVPGGHWKYQGEHCEYLIASPLCCTPETHAEVH